MTEAMPRAGLDVHAHQSHLFAFDALSGEVERRRIGGPPERALPHLDSAPT